MKFKFFAFIPAIAWFILTIILFTIPGDELPKDDLFGTPNIDKLAHVVLFFFLGYLFCRPLRTSADQLFKKQSFFKIMFAGIMYGIIIEVVQKYYIRNRSFDLLDITADSLGCVAAYLWSRVYFVTKIGPDGNRGRNQN